jgi:hypothetical protein
MTHDRYLKAVLTVIAILLAAIAFRTDLRNEAAADVAGMDSSDLRHDTDFRRAVESIIEDCSVDLLVHRPPCLLLWRLSEPQSRSALLAVDIG